MKKLLPVSYPGCQDEKNCRFEAYPISKPAGHQFDPLNYNPGRIRKSILFLIVVIGHPELSSVFLQSLNGYGTGSACLVFKWMNPAVISGFHHKVFSRRQGKCRAIS
jgi:hypothetical protein